MTQPAVTRQIKGLEDYYGTKLFERKWNSLILTEDGTRVLSFAQRITGLIDESLTPAEEHSFKVEGSCAIAANMTIGIWVLPCLISRFLEMYPAVNIKMSLDNTANIVKAVKRKVVNFGFIGVSLADPYIAVHPFCENKMKLVVSANHDIRRKSISWKELTNLPFICWQRGSGIRDTLEGWFRERDIKLNAKIELNNTEAIKECVRHGLGFSILPWCTIEKEVQAGIFRVIAAPYLDITLKHYICHYRDRRFSTPEKAFLEFIFQRIEQEDTISPMDS